MSEQFNTLTAIADRICSEADVNGAAVVSPLCAVEHPDQPDEKMWAIWVGAGSSKGFRFRAIALADTFPFDVAHTLAEVARGEIIAMLARRFKMFEAPETQVEAAQLCVLRWPCAETQGLLDDAVAGADPRQQPH